MTGTLDATIGTAMMAEARAAGLLDDKTEHVSFRWREPCRRRSRV